MKYRRRRDPKRVLVLELTERLVALSFIHHQLCKHLASNGKIPLDDAPLRDLTINMLVHEQGEKIMRVIELLSDLYLANGDKSTSPNGTSYMG